MRIFIKNSCIKDKNIDKLENKYFKKVRTEYYIYSLEGIYRMYKNKFYQIYPVDIPIINLNSSNGFSFLIDKGYFNISNNYSHIPLQHNLIKREITSLILDNIVSFTLDIERSFLNNKLVNLTYYINTKAADFKIIESELITFLLTNKNIL